MGRFQLVPTTAVRLNVDGEIVDFGAWVPGPVVRSKFDEPIRLMQLIGRFDSRDAAESAIKEWKRK
jgi:hypothetical protein